MEDPIVEETREARRQLDADFSGNLDLLNVYLRQIEHENAERVVKLHPKPVVGQKHLVVTSTQ